MSYTVKIVDNNSGEVVVDSTNIQCIVGAFGHEKGVRQLAACRAHSYVVCRTLNAAENAVKSVDDDDEKLKIKRQVLRLFGNLEDMGKEDTDS